MNVWAKSNALIMIAVLEFLNEIVFISNKPIRSLFSRILGLLFFSIMFYRTFTKTDYNKTIVFLLRFVCILYFGAAAYLAFIY